MEQLLAKKFTPEELLTGINLEEVLKGESCQIVVVHNDSQENSRKYANIEDVLPFKNARGEVTYFKLITSGNYKRVIERPDYL